MDINIIAITKFLLSCTCIFSPSVRIVRCFHYFNLSNYALLFRSYVLANLLSFFFSYAACQFVAKELSKAVPFAEENWRAFITLNHHDVKKTFYLIKTEDESR